MNLNEFNEFCKKLKNKFRDCISFLVGVEDFPCRDDQAFHNIKVYLLDKIKEKLNYNGKSCDALIVLNEKILLIEYFHPSVSEYDKFIKDVISSLINSKYSFDNIIERISINRSRELKNSIYISLKNEIEAKINDSKSILAKFLSLTEIGENTFLFFIIVDLRFDIECSFIKEIELFMTSRKRLKYNLSTKYVENQGSDFKEKEYISRCKSQILEAQKDNIKSLLKVISKEFRNLEITDCNGFKSYIKDLREHILCPQSP